MKAILHGRTPQAAAEAIVKGTRLKDVAERKRLAAGTAKSTDPMIHLAQVLDAPARKTPQEVRGLDRVPGGIQPRADRAYRFKG